MPKDPFLEPHAFVQVLHSLHTSRLFSSFPPPPSPPYFTYEAVRLIDRAYGKYRQSEAYKPHRVLLNKLDDLTTEGMRIVGGKARPSDAPGLGIAWDFAAIERLAVAGSKTTIQ